MSAEQKQDIIEQACWRRIGVLGDKPASCPELQRVMHCHNCEVFAQAARELFDRRAQQGEEPLPLTATGEELVSHGDASLLPLRLGNTWVGVATDQIHSISQQRPIHRVPFRSNERMLGVVSIQGEVMPCIALHVLLGLEREDKNLRNQIPGRYERMVVLNCSSLRVALPVDEVRDVTHFYHHELQQEVDCDEHLQQMVLGCLSEEQPEAYDILQLDMQLLEQRIHKELA